MSYATWDRSEVILLALITIMLACVVAALIVSAP